MKSGILVFVPVLQLLTQVLSAVRLSPLVLGCGLELHMWMVLVHRYRVALELNQIDLPRHGGELPFPTQHARNLRCLPIRGKFWIDH